MGYLNEFQSWLPPMPFGGPTVSTPPKPGDKAPSTDKLKVPQENGKPVVVTFLRHCGCPFAEKTYLTLRSFAQEHPDINFIAVSHSSQAHTDEWLKSLPPPKTGSSPSNLKLIVDDARELYGQWGLGASGIFHVLNQQTLGMLGTLKKEDGIDIRPTNSGTRWQTSGTYAVDAQGIVKWGGPAQKADEVPKWDEPLQAISAY